MGAYRILRRLSPAGGYLETWAGKQASAERPVLLKRLTTPAPATARLLENLRAMQGLGPSVLEVGNGNEGLWLVVEGTDGEPLRWVMSTLARAAGFIAPNEGLAVVARVAAALQAIHQQRLVHGDVSPATIMLTGRGEVQLHDGCIATTLEPQGEAGPCRSELNSLAPEQVNGPATMASDVFQLGLVLYELAVGRPLWSGPSAAHVCQTARGWPGLTRQKVKQVPEPWLTLLVTMLAVDPATRPTMEEVVAVLDQAVTQNHWATTDADIARLFARATVNRASPFGGEPPGAHDLNLTPLLSTDGLPGITPPGALVARITTKKMTREMLAVVRSTIVAAESTPTPIPHDAPLELRAAHLLVERGKLSRALLASVQEAVVPGGKSISAQLIEGGILDEDAFVSAAAEVTHTPFIAEKKLAETFPLPEAIALVPLELARETQSVPLGLKGGTQLMVAMVEPMDGEALAKLKAAIGPRSLIVFRAGVRALTATRTRIYAPSKQPELPGASTAISSAYPVVVSSELPHRVIDALLGMQGPRGTQAQKMVSLVTGVAKRLGLTSGDVTLAALCARAMVTSALSMGRAPHEVPRLAEVQERLGFSAADEFIEALHAYPARLPERPVVKAVVLAFAFAAHAGEARPTGSRLGGVLISFRNLTQLPLPLFEALSAELA